MTMNRRDLDEITVEAEEYVRELLNEFDKDWEGERPYYADISGTTQNQSEDGANQNQIPIAPGQAEGNLLGEEGGQLV